MLGLKLIHVSKTAPGNGLQFQQSSHPGSKYHPTCTKYITAFYQRLVVSINAIDIYYTAIGSTLKGSVHRRDFIFEIKRNVFSIYRGYECYRMTSFLWWFGQNGKLHEKDDTNIIYCLLRFDGRCDDIMWWLEDPAGNRHVSPQSIYNHGIAPAFS